MGCYGHSPCLLYTWLGRPGLVLAGTYLHKSIVRMKEEPQEALVRALRESATKLNDNDEYVGDARGARELQEKVVSYLRRTEDPKLILYSFWLDHLIDDIFYNLFADTVYMEETEKARDDVCKYLAVFFDRLANAIEADNARQELSSWETFVKKYLDRIEKVNRSSKGQVLR